MTLTQTRAPVSWGVRNGDSQPNELPLYSIKAHRPTYFLRNASIASWVVATFLAFMISWRNTGGGYHCSIALCVLLTVYCYSSTIFRPLRFCREVSRSCRANVLCLLKEEKRSGTLITVYWLFKLAMGVWFPEGEQSNGSPNSLIFFTVLFLTLYIVPTMVPPLLCPCVFVLNRWKHTGEHCSTPSRRSLTRCIRMASAVVWRWRRSIGLILCALLLTYLFDADLTSILRYVGKGKPCWPLLVPRHLRKTLPHPFQHAWLSKWSELFAGHKPGPFTTAVILLGRELGEVCRLLPVLIGTYIFAQLVVPREYRHIQLALFASIAGVVLGGVTSGSFKILFHRYRPNAYGNPYVWTGPATTVVNHWKFSKLDLSFPAGHTTVTSAVATCLYQMVVRCVDKPPLPVWLRVLLALCVYTYPCVVLISRVSDCYHWTSDAVFGVFLGYILGHAIITRLLCQRRQFDTAKLKITAQ